MAEYISLAQQEFLVRADRPTRVATAAERLYRRARGAGRLAVGWGRLVGRPARLLDLSAVAGRVQGQHSLGMQTVPLAQIQGSEGRTTDFDAAFRPLAEHSRGRWASIARARLDDAPLPGVELIRVGDVYYVRDGHHRISVARALGQSHIDAQVTLWDVAPAAHAATGSQLLRDEAALAQHVAGEPMGTQIRDVLQPAMVDTAAFTHYTLVDGKLPVAPVS